MIEINDEYISNLFFGKRQFIKEYYYKYLNDKESDIYKYIVNRYNDSLSFKESIYRIKYKIEIRPSCKECKKELKFIGGSAVFQKFCCKKCANKNIESINKVKETCLKKYGVDNVAKTKQAKEKYIKHIQEKYNDNTITNVWQAKEVIEKIKQTSLKHYGVTNYALTKEHQNKLKSKEVINKRENTKLIKHTINTSKVEEKSFMLLKEKYKDTIHHYKDKKRYPFNCDFYIPSLDLFIECQYSMFHNKRPYLGTKEDLNEIEILKQKSTKRKQETGKQKSRYDSVIDTWVNRDPLKRKIAKENNLNYIEFWNINELKEWLNS